MPPPLLVTSNQNDSSDESAASENSFSLALEKELLYDSDEADVKEEQEDEPVTQDTSSCGQQVSSGQLVYSQPSSPRLSFKSEQNGVKTEDESLYVDISSSPIFILSREGSPCHDHFETADVSNDPATSESEANHVSEHHSSQADYLEQNMVPTESFFVNVSSLPTFSLARERPPFNDCCQASHAANNPSTFVCETSNEYSAKMFTQAGKNFCVICNNNFTSNSLLQTHVMNIHMQVEPTIELRNIDHLITKTFKCQFCHEAFKSEGDLNSHAKQHANTIQHPFCNIRSLNVIFEKEDLHTYKCQLCDLTFKSKIDLDCHVMQHKNIIQCPFCNEKFISKDILLFQKHFETVHVTNNTGKSTNQSEPDQEKTKQSSNTDIPVCDDNIGVIKSQRRHITCKVCGLQLNCKSEMMSHMLTSHCDESSDSSENEVDMEYMCNKCDFTCNNESDIEKHCSSHDQNQHCDITSNSQLELNEHEISSHFEDNEEQEAAVSDDGQTELLENNNVEETNLSDDDVETVLFDIDDLENVDTLDDLENADTLDDTLQNFDEDEFSQEFLCNFCGFLADDKNILETHMKQKHIQIRVTHSLTETKTKSRNRLSSFIARDNVIRFNNSAEFSSLPTCSHCRAQFPSLSYLYDHAENTHAEIKEVLKCAVSSKANKPWKCNLCECSFNSEHFLMTHKLKHRGILQPYLCQLCDQYFTSEKYLYIHFYKIHNDSANCKLTLNSFKPTQLIENLNDNCAQYIIACSICKVVFNSKFNLFSHYLKEHKNHYVPSVKHPKKTGKFKCDACGNACTTLLGLRLHILNHFHIKSFMCTCCGNFYPQTRQIYKHRKSKNVKTSCNRFPILICNFCGLKTFRSKVLETHIKKSHLNIDKDIQLSMDIDDNSETTETDIKCIFCNSKFNEKESLELHRCLAEVILENHDQTNVAKTAKLKQKSCIHSNEPQCIVKKLKPSVPKAKIFVDSRCSRNGDFEQSNAVIIELDVSTSNEIYESRDEAHAKLEYVHHCNLCSVQFPSLSSLYKHSESKHNSINFTHKCVKNNRRFKCNLCFCSFSHHHIFMKHKLHHKNILPYMCQICKKIFSSLKLYHDHNKVHNTISNCILKMSSFVATDKAKNSRGSSESRCVTMCSVCRIKLKNLYYLYQHCLKEHKSLYRNLGHLCHKNNSNQGKLKCDACGKRFLNLRNLRIHLFRHFDIKPSSCKRCGKCFVDSSFITVEHFNSCSKGR